MRKWTVYMHENRVNGKKYIGITKQNPERRWQNGHGYRESPRFFNAIQRYGWDSFKHEILFSDLTAEAAARYEVDLIAKYKTLNPEYGYNLDPGGGGTSPKTALTREKMSAARRGTHPTAETIERLRVSHLGKTTPPEVRAKMSVAQKGVKKSADHARHIGEAKSKAVVMLSKGGEVLSKFQSLTAAQNATGVSFKNISAVCRGKKTNSWWFYLALCNR